MASRLSWGQSACAGLGSISRHEVLLCYASSFFIEFLILVAFRISFVSTSSLSQFWYYNPVAAIIWSFGAAAVNNACHWQSNSLILRLGGGVRIASCLRTLVRSSCLHLTEVEKWSVFRGAFLWFDARAWIRAANLGLVVRAFCPCLGCRGDMIQTLDRLAYKQALDTLFCEVLQKSPASVHSLSLVLWVLWCFFWLWHDPSGHLTQNRKSYVIVWITRDQPCQFNSNADCIAFMLQQAFVGCCLMAR